MMAAIWTSFIYAMASYIIRYDCPMANVTVPKRKRVYVIL